MGCLNHSLILESLQMSCLEFLVLGPQCILVFFFFLKMALLDLPVSLQLQVGLLFSFHGACAIAVVG